MRKCHQLSSLMEFRYSEIAWCNGKNGISGSPCVKPKQSEVINYEYHILHHTFVTIFFFVRKYLNCQFLQIFVLIFFSFSLLTFWNLCNLCCFFFSFSYGLFHKSRKKWKVNWFALLSDLNGCNLMSVIGFMICKQIQFHKQDLSNLKVLF